MKLLNSLIILPLASMLALSCTRNHNQNNNNGLPPATQTGAGVIACLLNGKPWTIHFYSTDANSFFGSFGGDTLKIGGSPAPVYTPYNSIQTISIGVWSGIKQGQVYNLADSTRSYCKYITDSVCDNAAGGSGGYGNLYSAYAVSGSIYISKLDTVAQIASGLFSCTFLMQGCDSTRVTDGRFDIHYY